MTKKLRTTEIRLYTDPAFDKMATISCESELIANSLAATLTESGEYAAYVGPLGLTDVEYKNGEKQPTEAEKKAQETDYPLMRLWANVFSRVVTKSLLEKRLRMAREQNQPQDIIHNGGRFIPLEEVNQYNLIDMLRASITN